MESKDLEQSSFKGIVSDINQIDLNITEGPISDNFNGRIVQVGKNKFAWTSINGTTKAFEILSKQGENKAQENGKANIYIFDDRIFAPEKNSIIDMKFSASTTHTYEFILEIQAYKADFTTVEVNSPPLQLKILQSISTNSSSEITGTYTLGVGYRFGTSSSFSYVYYNLAYGSTLLENIYLSIVNSYNTAILSAGTPNGLYGSTAVYGTDGISKYLQITIATNKTSNIVVKSLKGENVDSPTYRNSNRRGFGKGSVYDNLKYPSAPQYPIPGSDYKINPFSDSIPYGLCRVPRNGKTYCVYSGKITYKNGYTPYTDMTTGSIFKLNAETEDLSDVKEYLELCYSNKEEPLMIELNPIGFGYGLTIQKYKAAETFKTASYRQNGIIGIDKNKALLFLSIGTEQTKIVLINTENNKIEVTTLIDTSEDLDLNEDRKVIGFTKFDNENNLRTYWTSGHGHIRVLNLNDIPTEEFEISTRLFKPCDFGEINVNRVQKSGGGLLVGSYQFCFALSIDGFVWTRTSQHTAPVMIGQSYFGVEGLVGTDVKVATYAKPNQENDASYRGAPFGTKTTELINILITNIDKRYNYIKVFSIESISGSNSKVVNCIYNDKLKEEEKYTFTCVHLGSTNIVEGNLNLSEVTSRKIVPKNVKWITQINNRMIISNYTLDYKLRNDLPSNSNIRIVKTMQSIGCDTLPNSTVAMSGYKHWINQYHHKTFPAYGKFHYAWVYIDEYGNESEPSNTFELELDFRKFINNIYQASYNHPDADIQWNKNTLTGETWDENIIKATQQSLWSTEIEHTSTLRVNGGYDLFALGIYLKINSPIFPSWAKKAILVEKKENPNNGYTTTEGIGILTTNGITMSMLPDAEGYNVFSNYVFKQGDKIRILNVSFYDRKQNGKYLDPQVYLFNKETEYIETNDYLFNISGFKQEIYPQNNQAGYTIGDEVKMPDSTINARNFDITFNISTSQYNALVALTSATGSKKIFVKFQIERENIITNEDIEEFANTNFSIDLKGKYENDYRRAFIGNSFISTNHQIVTMRDRYFQSTYLNNVFGSNSYTRIMPVIVVPLITRFNMAMADDSVFPFLRMNPVISSYTASGFRQVNRDYAATNNLCNYKFISQDFLKPRKDFNNLFYISNAAVIGQIYDSYTDFKAAQSLEVQSDYGKIVAVFEFQGFLIVQQQYGCRKFIIDSNEFVQSTKGTMISISNGEFVNTNPNDISETFGSNYPGIRGEKGIYFISSQFQILCLVNTNEIKLLSIEGGFQKILNENIIIDDQRTLWNFNDIIMFRDKNESLIYIYSISRKKYKIISSDNPMVLYITDISPIVGEVYCYYYITLIYSPAEGIFKSYKTLRYIKILTVSIVSSNFSVTYEIIADNPTNSEKFEEDYLYLVTVKKPELLAYNENFGVLEFRNDNIRINQSLNKISIDVFFGNQLNIENENSSKYYNQVSNNLNVPMDTKKWNILFAAMYGIVINENTTLDNLATNFTINIQTNLSSNSNVYFLGSKKEFHFIEGVKYTISFNISVISGDYPFGKGLFFGPLYDLLIQFATPVGIPTFNDVVYYGSGSATKTYSFTVNKSFVSPLALNAKNWTILDNTNVFCIKLMQFDYEEIFESHLELYVSNKNSEIISFDNLILTVENEKTPNRIEVYSKEQAQTLVISNPNIYGKLRLRQFQMALPKLNTKERLRSTYFKIKFVYTSNGVRNIINSLKSFFKTV